MHDRTGPQSVKVKIGNPPVVFGDDDVGHPSLQGRAVLRERRIELTDKSAAGAEPSPGEDFDRTAAGRVRRKMRPLAARLIRSGDDGMAAFGRQVAGHIACAGSTTDNQCRACQDDTSALILTCK